MYHFKSIDVCSTDLCDLLVSEGIHSCKFLPSSLTWKGNAFPTDSCLWGARTELDWQIWLYKWHPLVDIICTSCSSAEKNGEKLPVLCWVTAIFKDVLLYWPPFSKVFFHFPWKIRFQLTKKRFQFEHSTKNHGLLNARLKCFSLDSWVVEWLEFEKSIFLQSKKRVNFALLRKSAFLRTKVNTYLVFFPVFYKLLPASQKHSTVNYFEKDRQTYPLLKKWFGKFKNRRWAGDKRIDSWITSSCLSNAFLMKRIKWSA